MPGFEERKNAGIMSYIKQLTKINLGQRMIHSTRDEQKAAAVLLG